MKAVPKRPSLAGEAYEAIRERILRGEVAVGQVISRRKIAAEFGMSFLPVSEAFLRLEFEGLLESRPRAGTRVRIPTREDVEGQYVVREALEVQAAKRFAMSATPEECSELLKLAARVDSMSGQSDASRSVFLGLHERLHHRIADCGRCPALREAIEKTCSLSSVWLCLGRSFPEVPRRHQELMEGLVTGDVERAAKTMQQHIQSSRDWMLRRLEPYFNLGNKQGQSYSRDKSSRPSDLA